MAIAARRIATRHFALMPMLRTSIFRHLPTLVDLKDGRQILVVQDKSAIVYALDPDQQGKIIWQQPDWKGSAGAVWGPAIEHEDHLYAAGRRPARRGMVALDLRSGEKLWSVPRPPCGDKKPCSQVQDAAIHGDSRSCFCPDPSTAICGLIRPKDGTILWDYDTVGTTYKTVNGVAAKGGSISDGGPAVVGGMLFINSGYSHHSGIMPGNVLLAFSPERAS